jgi:hypothetical protein
MHYRHRMPLGIFQTRTVGRRVILTLNKVKIANHGDNARTRAQADRLIEAVADHRNSIPGGLSRLTSGRSTSEFQLETTW